jgi:hypothetical protein
MSEQISSVSEAALLSRQFPPVPNMSLPDEERSRLLRRADWRFLLPTPAPRKSICFVDGLLADTTAEVSEVCLMASSTDESTRGCDLAVAADPLWVTLRRAWEALRPGGSCYIEWNRAWPGPAGVRRRLEAAGFEEVACYAPRPIPDRGTGVWVPLESDRAVQYFLTRLTRQRRGLRQLLQWLRALVWQSGLRLRFTVPLCTVARKPLGGPVGSRSMGSPAAPSAVIRGLQPQLKEELLSNWEAWGFGSPPRELSTLLVTRGKRSINKAVALIFAESHAQPLLAIKRARVPESVPPMRNEAEVLQAIQDRPRGIQGAPRVLFCQELDGFVTLAETFVQGRPVAEVLSPQNCRALALQAADWSADLAQPTCPVPRDIWWGRLIEPVISDFDRAFGPAIDRGALQESLAVLSSLGPLPLVCEQRDFSPWNLLLATNGRLGVLDWESAERQGLPGLDLIYCLTYFSAYLDGSIYSGRLWEARRRCSVPGTEMGSIAQECFERYLGKVGISAAALHPLAVLTWMIHARSEYKHFCLDLGKPPEAGTLHRSVFLRLWHEELGSKAAK